MRKMVFGKGTKLSRRKFIVGSAATAGGGLALGLNVPFAQRRRSGAADEVNVWVVIKPDDTCVIRIARSEMGQGTLTGLAQLVAEELECDWSKVTTEGITPGRNLARKRAWGDMGTGGSQGIRQSQDYVRRGGAAARMMLLQAAADQWKVPVAELAVSDGVISARRQQAQRSSYGKVAAAAAKITPPDPKAIKLKDPKDWKIAGKPLKRLDTADKLNGSKVYAIDVKLPGMLCAAIKDCPVFGGKLRAFDDSQDRRHARRQEGGAGEGHRASPWSPTPGGAPRPRSTRCRSSGTRATARRCRARRIAAISRRASPPTATNGDRKNGDALKAIEDAREEGRGGLFDAVPRRTPAWR